MCACALSWNPSPRCPRASSFSPSRQSAFDWSPTTAVHLPPPCCQLRCSAAQAWVALCARPVPTPRPPPPRPPPRALDKCPLPSLHPRRCERHSGPRTRASSRCGPVLRPPILIPDPESEPPIPRSLTPIPDSRPVPLPRVFPVRVPQPPFLNWDPSPPIPSSPTHSPYSRPMPCPRMICV